MYGRETRSPCGSLHRCARAAVIAALLLVAWQPVRAQENGHAVKANWALSERFSPDALRPYVFSSNLQARWINDTDSMWYSWRDRAGTRFMLVVPKTKSKRPLFDHTRFAEELSRAARKAYEPHDLPMTNLTFNQDGRGFRFVLDSVRYEWDMGAQSMKNLGRLTRQELQRENQAGGGGRGGRGGGGGGGGGRGGGGNQDFRNFSPDSTAFVFAREHNLYLVEVARGDTVQLSSDGVQYYSFGARDTAQQQQQQQQQQEDDQEEGGQQQQGGGRGRDPRVRANVSWSPDSRAFYVSRNDSRKVKDLYLVNVLAEPRPTLSSYRYAMPGEEEVAQQELWTFRRGDTKLTRLPVEKWKDQRLFDMHWITGSDRLRLVRRDRLQRNLELIEVGLPSNDLKVLLTESVEEAFLERQNVRYLKTGGDFLWWSERSGWGHLYLYDHNGTLKGPVTSGSWRVDGVADVDTVRRVVYLTGLGRQPDDNPYYRHLYRVNADGTGFTLLNEGNADHTASLSPSKRYVVDNASRVDLEPKAILRDGLTGNVLLELEAMDLSRLNEMGFKMPEQFVVKAADGVTDIYGNMWKPFDFDPSKKYPIIANVYPGPQTEQVTTTFSATASQMRLAQLGFIVIQIGNRGGSPRRSNAYHSYGYYNLRDYGLADKKAGIEQLAARFPWIDINKVGIFGHSGGGFMTAAALLQPPYNDFFKVGVSSAGNHDNNVYNQNWSEQHHGLREVPVKPTTTTTSATGNGNSRNDSGAEDQQQQQQAAETKFEIHVPANHELAANLKGRLLLVHGDMDNNVHPAGTIRLANALIKANKRFDLFIMPGKPHGFGDMQGYFTRMMFEYFAEHLLGDYYRGNAEIRQ
jgi:dipeptidyl aminopeptidase/acylaminoacyl peptidase